MTMWGAIYSLYQLLLSIVLKICAFEVQRYSQVQPSGNQQITYRENVNILYYFLYLMVKFMIIIDTDKEKKERFTQLCLRCLKVTCRLYCYLFCKLHTDMAFRPKMSCIGRKSHHAYTEYSLKPHEIRLIADLQCIGLNVSYMKMHF